MKEERPWGWYEVIDQGDRFKVKNIEVKPGHRLSHQKHHHRTEHWIVVSGTAEVQLNDARQLIVRTKAHTFLWGVSIVCQILVRYHLKSLRFKVVLILKRMTLKGLKMTTGEIDKY